MNYSNHACIGQMRKVSVELLDRGARDGIIATNQGDKLVFQ